MDIGNILNAIGITASGAMPVINQHVQQQQAINALRSAIGPQPGTPGFAPYPPQGMAPPPALTPGQPAPIPSMPPSAPGIGVQSMAPPANPAQMAPPPTGARGGMTPPAASAPAPSTQQPDMVARQEQMMLKIMDSPGSPESKMQAMQMLGAFLTPAEKMQMQLEKQQADIQAKQQRLDDTVANLKWMKQYGAGQSGANTDKRVTEEDKKLTLNDLEKDISDNKTIVQTLITSGKMNSPEYTAAKAGLDAAFKAKKDYVAGQRGGAKPDVKSATGGGGTDYKSLEDLQAAYAKGSVTAEDAQKIAIENGWATE